MPYGYYVQSGYVGYVNGRKMLFCSEEEYLDYISNEEGDQS